ncbi:MAG: CcmE/CycJ protein [uncultured bacterium]|nr:MAG: CcmE/CycJ protein [uncultured bacterium]
MNRKQKIRLAGIISIIIILCAAVGLILYALKQNINLFYTPTQIMQTHIQANQIIRIGGYVKQQSVHYDAQGTHVNFMITDKTHDILVNYAGVLPNLFREGQGVVVTGKLNNSHTLQASEVLAKHDEKYMPWPLAKELQPSARKQV